MLQQSQTLKTTAKNKQAFLNSNNYYDSSTDLIYQSPTYFKKFLACEAETMAEIKGEYKPDFKDALLVGNYLHSYFESKEAHQKFIDDNQEEMYSKRKPYGLLSKYKIADSMIETLANDEMFQKLYQGDKEVIVTGQIDNVDWKGKIDCLNLDRKYFIDLKTTRDIYKTYWDQETHKRESFIASWNYQLQMYVYQELIHQTFGVWCEPYIVAVSKQDIPDKQVFSIPDYRMEDAKTQIRLYQDHIEDVKAGRVEPTRCERCEYCRSTKKLSEIISMDDLIE